jgi:hypothetical protein
MTMKNVKTVVIIGLLAVLVIAEPAFAEIPCADFTRNSDGSWTPLHPFTFDGPVGLVQVDPGHSYNAGMPGVPGEIAKHLALHCPGVPRMSTHSQPPMPHRDPYLIGNQPTLEEGKPWVSPRGEVITYYHAPPQKKKLPDSSKGTVILNPAAVDLNPATVDLR